MSRDQSTCWGIAGDPRLPRGRDIMPSRVAGFSSHSRRAATLLINDMAVLVQRGRLTLSSKPLVSPSCTRAVRKESSRERLSVS